MATEMSAVGAPDKVLLLVDIQNDFCEGGSLPVAGSAAIFPVVNQWIDKALAEHWLIVASRDWHPVDHCSFRQSGAPGRNTVSRTPRVPGFTLPYSYRIVPSG